MKKILTALLFMSALTGCMGYAPGQQSYWDAQVREMCEKDGGVTVYERVKITAEEYLTLGGAYGVIPVPDEYSKRQETPYFSRTLVKEINSHNPKVTRRDSIIVRRSDQKILGRLISYDRVGGDFPNGISHESYFSCKNISGIRLDVERQIFDIQGVEK